MNARAFGSRLSVMTTDVAACVRHFWIRLRAAVTDPIAALLLLFAGLSTIPLWHVMVGYRRYHFVITLWTLLSAPILLVFLWAPLVLVVVSISGSLFALRSRGHVGEHVLPALPLGPRSRVAAEVLAGLLAILATRAVGFMLSPQDLFGYAQSVGHYWRRFAEDTLVGALVACPLLIALAAAPRLDWRGVARPGALLVFLLTTQMIWMASLPLLAATSLALSAVVLASVGGKLDIHISGIPRRRQVPLSRPSPGPGIMFRRDLCLGTLRTLWPLFALTLLAPLASVLYPRAHFPVMVFQFCVLLVVLLYPFGLRLFGTGTVFSGYFAGAWSTLPVSREGVVRAVYGYGLVGSGLLFLLLCAYTFGTAAFPSLPVYELAGIPLVAGVMVCEVVGDRRRGALAFASLVAFQIVWPMTLTALPKTMVVNLSPRSHYLIAGAYVLALIGGLPPLVHLRRVPSRRIS